MFCQYCGSRIDNNQMKFCYNCGSELVKLPSSNPDNIPDTANEKKFTTSTIHTPEKYIERQRGRSWWSTKRNIVFTLIGSIILILLIYMGKEITSPNNQNITYKEDSTNSVGMVKIMKSTDPGLVRYDDLVNNEDSLKSVNSYKYSDDEPDPPDFLPVDKQPVPQRRVMPIYPEDVRRSGVEGVVWVKILVGKDGRSKKVLVIKSDKPSLNQAAIKAALLCTFTPAQVKNQPVAVWVAMPFRFKLSK